MSMLLQPNEILKKAKAAGVQLTVTQQGGLKVMPASAMTSDFRALLKAHKLELVDYLRHVTTMVATTAANDLTPVRPPPDFTELAREVFEERAAIAEFDGGLARSSAEEMARLHTDYLLHHWGCMTCIAAGKGYGVRCEAGGALWTRYEGSVQVSTLIDGERRINMRRTH